MCSLEHTYHGYWTGWVIRGRDGGERAGLYKSYTYPRAWLMGSNTRRCGEIVRRGVGGRSTWAAGATLLPNGRGDLMIVMRSGENLVTYLVKGFEGGARGMSPQTGSSGGMSGIVRQLVHLMRGREPRSLPPLTVPSLGTSAIFISATLILRPQLLLLGLLRFLSETKENRSNPEWCIYGAYMGWMALDEDLRFKLS
ncbi:hypothetical protein BC629DRAFT_1442872 [Irpex lacteus]|nr:hypothetical protein BC629DRAFT_1442872 [Irpex lacteus]